eukprot:765757-Hanusia_phi.AAC.1
MELWESSRLAKIVIEPGAQDSSKCVSCTYGFMTCSSHIDSFPWGLTGCEFDGFVVWLRRAAFASVMMSQRIIAPSTCAVTVKLVDPLGLTRASAIACVPAGASAIACVQQPRELLQGGGGLA